MRAFDGHRSRTVSSAAWAVLLFSAAGAQDASHLERNLDDLQYRMGQIEGELGKLKKAPPQAAAPKVIRSRADSLLPGLTARLDSLTARLARLEADPRAADGRGTGAAGAAPGAAARSRDSLRSAEASAPAQDSGTAAELRALRADIRALSGLLVAARENVPAKGASAPTAPGQASGEGASSAPTAAAGANPLPGAAGPVSAAHAGPPLGMPAPAAGPVLPPGMVLLGDIQIQGERRLANGPGQDNLDNFWGRVNLGAEYQGPGFQSKANVRIFPEGFGFEPLTGATFDTTGQGSLKTQTQPASKIVVNHAWARFSSGAYGLKVGRFETQESQSASYGNYIDLGPSGGFLARPAIHNAVEGGWASGPWSSSLMLESGDRKLDRGSLRALQGFSGPAGLKASLGYRSNLFDRVRFPSAEILHRIDAGAVSPKFDGWQAFAEAAWIQMAGAADQTPVLVGVRPPMGKYLDALSLEAEWLPDRKAAGKDKPVLFNAYVRKTLGRARLETGFYSDPADPDADAFSLGMRMTASLK
jgi:hypothetical protein